METRYESSFLDWLKQRPPGPLLLQDVAHFIHQAAIALQDLHNHHVVHQSITPSSFFIRSNHQFPSLPDLQLADPGRTAPTSGISSSGQPISGTPTSMAPEQWRGTAVPATDQYALAIMAYQLLTWRSPLQGTQEQLMHQHLYVQPQPPSTFNPRIPPAVDAVILRALAKRPEDRYP